MLRFAPNLSLLFTELPFLERFAAAATAGFAAVEFQFPYAYDLAAVRAAVSDSGLQVALFNLPAGDWAAGDRGIASDPERAGEFRAGLEQARRWADGLGCRRLNCLAGCRGDAGTLCANLRLAADALARDGITLLVEPINRLDMPGFLLPNAAAAVDVLARAGAPAARLQLDLYHEQRAAGNVTETMRRLRLQIAHVQVADCPGRHQPGTGEMNFPFLLGALADTGYDGYVGLEYVPEPDTLTSLEALRALGIGAARR